MAGGSFDHNLSGITEGQGAKWDDTDHELVPADFAEYLHELLDVTGTASPVKGNLIVGDGTTWRVLPVGDDGQRLTPESTDPLGLEWVDAASGGGGASLTVEDDGVVVTTDVSTINFRENLVVTDLGSGEVAVDAASGGTGGSGEFTLIEEVLLAADATHIEFSSIAATFKDLLFVGRLRSDRGATTDALEVRVGNTSVDTGSNYDWLTQTNAATASGSGATSARLGNALAGNNARTNLYGQMRLLLIDYAETTYERGFEATGGAPGITASNGVGSWRNRTDVIDVVRFFPTNGPNFLAGSMIRLYGVG